MLRWYTADLHIHTCLSPCSTLLMSPQRIVAEAAERSLDIIAVTDHNAAANAGAVMRAAEGTCLTVLPGMEICTREEVHLLAVLESLASALALQSLVQAHMSGSNDPDLFGLQVIANEKDEVEGFEDRLLIGATDIPLEEITEAVHGLGGAVIASHIDRESYSIIGQLGFIPDGMRPEALEISSNMDDERAAVAFEKYRHIPFIRNSDAHLPGQMGRNVTRYLLEEPSLPEIILAFQRRNGRRTMACREFLQGAEEES